MCCATHGSRTFFQGGGPNGDTSDLKFNKQKKEGGGQGGGVMVKLDTIFMLIALYFFNFNIVSEHWGRFEGRGLRALAQKNMSDTG